MPNLDLLIAFTIATAVFAYMPGPSTLYAAAQTIANGKQGGLFAALGIHIGGYIHVIAAAFGLATLFEIIPVLYTIMKFSGAAYLIWLGVAFFLQRQIITPDKTGEPKNATMWQSATVEILNPKTALFYIAFLPQFTDPAATFPLWLQLLVLGTIVNVMFSSADLICVVLAEKVSALFKRSVTAQKTANKIGGAILIGLGTHLTFGR